MKKIGILFMLLVSLMFVGCVSEADFIKKNNSTYGTKNW